MIPVDRTVLYVPIYVRDGALTVSSDSWDRIATKRISYYFQTASYGRSASYKISTGWKARTSTPSEI